MYLSSTEQKKALKVIELLGQSLDSETMRTSTGHLLLDLLDASQFASFVWNDDKKTFSKGVTINMSQDNISNYNDYYQKHDPITNQLMTRRSATLVNDIMPQQELIKTEFYNDFLSKDKLYYGINLFAYDGNKNTGDFRVWRKRGQSNFDCKSIYILDFIKPYFCNAMRNIKHHESMVALVPEQNGCNKNLDINKLMSVFPLTKREAQVTLEILQGRKDNDIAKTFHIAFTTLRTHIKHIFQKLEVNNRASLVHKVLSKL